jgi:N-formylglutamate amidohydrolase
MISEQERIHLLEMYYYPHHKAFELEVERVLEKYDRCLIIDCHSFSSVPLPYELNQAANRPQICIGTDSFHTTVELEHRFVHSFKNAGFTVAINKPYSGAIVPLRYYKCEKKVQSIMIEVNRLLYLDEGTGELLKNNKLGKLLSTIINETIR